MKIARFVFVTNTTGNASSKKTLAMSTLFLDFN